MDDPTLWNQVAIVPYENRPSIVPLPLPVPIVSRISTAMAKVAPSVAELGYRSPVGTLRRNQLSTGNDQTNGRHIQIDGLVASRRRRCTADDGIRRVPCQFTLQATTDTDEAVGDPRWLHSSPHSFPPDERDRLEGQIVQCRQISLSELRAHTGTVGLFIGQHQSSPITQYIRAALSAQFPQF